MVDEVMNTLTPYEVVERDDIQYTYCADYGHISRYRGLRQVIHQGMSSDRYVALETSNPFSSSSDVRYYTVPSNRENRLDLIASEQLGSASYAWVLAYFNNIEDGFTVPEGTRLAIPASVTTLFESGEILSPVPATKLNVGSE